MDVSLLLKPRSDELVSGENLEYDPLFTDLELAAQPGEERQEGDKIIPAEDPDWKVVEDKAIDVLAESHDLRAAVFYGQAVLHTEGLKGLSLIIDFIRRCLEEHWDTCHPQLDEDDGDPTMRINAVQGLAGSEQVVKALRRTALTDSRMFGRMSLRDMEIADGTIPVPSSMSEVPDSSSVGAALQDTDSDTLASVLAAAEKALGNVKAIDDIFGEKTPGQGPSLELLTTTLNAIIKRLGDAGGGAVEGADGALDGSDALGAAAQGGGAPLSGAVNSPADVAAALDKIISYYRRTEPSSPVPILLERAKKLVGADFLTIINDMAPRGLENVNVIGGLEDD